MESTFFERIQVGLLQKRESLVEWLRNTPPQKRRMHLGPAGEQAVRAHVETIDSALEKASAHTLGICEVCEGYVEPELLEMDYTSCVCLSHYSEEERRNLEADLELSQTIQRALLPQQLPEIPGLDVAVFTRPAQIVGGDYFDFLRFRDGSHGIVIGDVAGKGIAASMLMASLQAFLRTVAPESDSPVTLLTRLNHLFSHNIHYTTFITLFVARWDDNSRELDYCNAGHNPPLLYRQGGNGSRDVRWLRAGVPAIGLVEEGPFDCETIGLAPGDYLLLYTDGVVEANGDGKGEFGYERLSTLLERAAHLPPIEMVNSLRNELHSFVDGQSLADDTTIIACRATV